jgi:hypothetical protein
MAERSGTVTLLGAGSSAEAGYPTAGALLREYRDLLKQDSTAQGFVPKPDRPSNEWEFLSSKQLFDRLWSAFTTAVPEEEGHYLENMFAFYEVSDRLATVFSESGASAEYFAKSRLRRMRDIAVGMSQSVLAPGTHPRVDHLRQLFGLRGPNRQEFVVATVNVDLAIEREALELGIRFADGFGPPKVEVPAGWESPALDGLARRWRHLSGIARDFVGFDTGTTDGVVLKPHGSLGWYVLEEGSGTVGERASTRLNVPYRHFRLDYDRVLGSHDLADTRSLLDLPPDLTEKFGAVWIRPWMAFARGNKLSPDRPALELVATLARLLESARNVLVIGYSWADPHVNDVVLTAVGQGATLVDINLDTSSSHRSLRLWQRKMPTTFKHVAKRLFTFSGGASRCLAGTVILPDGSTADVDITSLLDGNESVRSLATFAALLDA